MDFSQLTAEQKAELAATGTRLAMPFAQATFEYWLDTKRIEKRKEFEVEMAERRAESLQQMQMEHAAEGGGEGAQMAAPSGGAMAGSVTEAEAPEQRMSTLRERSDCSFCHEVLDGLETAGGETKQRGLDELEQYVAMQEKLVNQGADQETMEARLSSLVDQWEVVPRVLAEHGGR